MNDIYTVSDNSNFISYADDTILSSPMCSFSSGCDGGVERVSILINSELNKSADWLAVNKLSLNVQKNQTHDISLPPKDFNGKWYPTPYDK